MSKVVTIIFTSIAIILFFFLILTGLFSVAVFIGMLLLGLLYLFGYFYVLNHFKMQEEIDRRETQNKKKLDYCWDRANSILRKMVGGQGLSWNKGVGRRSEYQTFHNGIQLCGFRSMEGYLADSQQLVVIIYDIENDDVVRYIADPPPDIIDNHFYNFKPFQSKESFTGSGFNRFPSRHGSSRYRPRGISLHRGEDEGYDNYDNFSSKVEPSEDVVTDSLKKLKGN